MFFHVRGGGEKQFATVTHHHECDVTGKVTITKGTTGSDPGVSVSAEMNDPTTP